MTQERALLRRDGKGDGFKRLLLFVRLLPIATKSVLLPSPRETGVFLSAATHFQVSGKN